MLDIIVPVYNEADNIEKLFNNIAKSIHVNKKVIIVYDFKKDTTIPVIKRIKNNYNFDIILEKNIYGKGALNAIKTGINKSTSERILVVMADLSDSLDVVDKMYKKMNKGYDLVCGSRYMKGGKQYGGPFLKGLFSRMAGLTLHLFTGIPTHDVTNSFKMYSNKLFDIIHIESTGGFEIGMEITVKAYLNGFKITEVPSKWFDRQEGKSNFHMWKWIPHYLYWYFYCIKGSFLKK